MKRGLCAYNYARRLENKEISKAIISKMQHFYVIIVIFLYFMFL
jgi:hypothetical protein